jgi:carbon-monoxide dehydrogenase medium subunit
VKPPRFDYYAPDSLGEAVALLERYSEAEVKLIAGGQSLVPLMNLRLARPEVLIDLRQVPDLGGIRHEAGEWTIGALVRHSEIEDSDELFAYLPVVRAVVHHIGYRPIRNRGTVGGSVCHADPAAEWPMLVRLLDAQLVITGSAGDRACPATDFFHGFMACAIRPDEVLRAVRFADIASPWRWGFEEFVRAAGDFAVSAVGVILEVDGTLVTAARVAAAGQGPTPMRLGGAEMALVGRPFDEAATHRLASDAAAAEVDPSSDGNGSADYKRRLLQAQLRRLLTRTSEVTR